jgi:hypothetical protein
VATVVEFTTCEDSEEEEEVEVMFPTNGDVG